MGTSRIPWRSGPLSGIGPQVRVGMALPPELHYFLRPHRTFHEWRRESAGNDVQVAVCFCAGGGGVTTVRTTHPGHVAPGRVEMVLYLSGEARGGGRIA